MTIARCISGALLLFPGFGWAASSDAGEHAVWNADRAAIYSRVCMDAAPGFSTFEEKARAAGLTETMHGWNFEPEVFISLQEAQGHCICHMTMGAPDVNALVAEIMTRLIADHADAYAGTGEGSSAMVPFIRDGVAFASYLTPKEVDGHWWLSGDVAVPGACETEAGT